MAALGEFGIQLYYDRRSDGRFHIHSPNIPGLHLAGPDLDAIKVDVEPLIKDLLFHNSGIVVDTIEWIPSLEEIVSQLKQSAAVTRPVGEQSKLLLITGRAA
jgi:hypothetical protein